MAKNDSWGIEIGANAIKALRLVGDPKSGVGVADYDVIPFKTVLSAPDVNAEEAIRVNRISAFEWLAKVRSLGSVWTEPAHAIRHADFLVGHVDKFHTQQRDTIPDVIEGCDRLLAALPALRK